MDWTSTDKKFLPEGVGLLDQPARAMKVLFVLDSVADKITKQLLEQRKPEKEKNA